jgi:NAD(P)-dependent dehydrogenase (short-subunit alcohol dehydrogenase family)
LARDLKARNIRVNALSPGYTETSIFETLDWAKEQFEAVKKEITNTIPFGRWGQPKEIAEAVLFLASSESSYISGIELFVDGGAVQT